MFHFPRFPFASYEFTGRILRHYPQWVSPFGHLRVNGCLPPDRSLSQATTSFFGMFCRAIHQYTLNALHSLIAGNVSVAIWTIFDLRLRKLFRRTKKYVSKALLVAHRNYRQISTSMHYHHQQCFSLCISSVVKVRR